jgi:hypothetical protein
MLVTTKKITDDYCEWRVYRGEHDRFRGPKMWMNWEGQFSDIQLRKMLAMACQSPTTEHRTQPDHIPDNGECMWGLEVLKNKKKFDDIFSFGAFKSIKYNNLLRYDDKINKKI